MGQAWCKEKTSRAQDSKSPLDRVFVRCAHRIYPGLKEEGSVLGGATQRVTSSEIGYAGSPPRELLTRGRSIDSVDRPFHPSDWVDVNLEVPSTPRASSVLTNLTVDTCLYPATTPTSSCSNLKDTTPVPPPRRRKRNRGRPLPPKPDETVEKTNNKETRRVNGSEEPFYSSVSTPRLVDDYGKTTTTTKLNDEVDEDEEENEDDDENDDEDDDDNDDDNGNDRSEDVVQAKTTTKERKESCRIGDNPRPEGRRTKEIYEHKVNGTGRIISSDMVAGRRSVPINVGRKSDRRTRSREEEKEEEKKKEVEMEEEQHRYEKFVRGRTTKDTSTPNRRETKKKQDERKNSTTERSSKEEEEEEEKRDGITKGRNAITKNCSTVSLPSYHELDVTRRATRDAKDKDHDDHAVQQGTWEKMGSKGAVRSSTGSLPAESLLSPFSQKTSVRLEDYIPQRGSSENLSPYRETVKLDRRENGLDDGDGDSGGFLKYDPSKLEDWDFSDISNCESNHRRSPLEGATITEIGTVSGGSRSCGGIDDVDSPRNALENEAIEGKVSSYDVPRQPITLQKPESYGAKTASVEVGKDSRSSVNRNDHPIDQRGSSKHFEPSTAVEIDKPSGPPLCREPFFLNEEKHRSASDTIGGWCSGRDDVGDSDRSEPSRKRTIFERRLSNESEPYEDPCESKELGGARSDTQNIVGTSSSLIRTISEESLPREMLSEEVDVEVLEEKRKKFDAFDSSSKEVSSKEVSSRTPPPSPEVRIKAEVLDNDHSTLLKILKEETTEGSNFSSMTPSLTELEVALSDMLEKEDKMVDLETSKDKQETSREERKDDGPPEASSSSCLEERWRKDDEVAEGGQLLLLLLQEDGGERTKEGKGSLVVDEELPSKSSRETAETTRRPLDDRPEKPGRWRHISIEEMQEKALEKIPTPPRRRNRDSVATAVLKDSNRRSGMNGSTGVTESICNDRLI